MEDKDTTNDVGTTLDVSPSSPVATSTLANASSTSATSAGAGPSLHVSLPPNFPQPAETSFSPPSSKNGIGGTSGSSLKQLLSPNIVASITTTNPGRSISPASAALVSSPSSSNGRGEGQIRSPFSLHPGSTAIYNPNAPFSPPETYTYSRTPAHRDSPGSKSAKSTPGRSMSVHSDPHEDLFRAEFREPHRAEFDLSLPPSLLSSGRKASVSLHLFKETSSKPSVASTSERDKQSAGSENRDKSQSRQSTRPPTSRRGRSDRTVLSYLSEHDDAPPLDVALPPGLLSPPDSELGQARPATPSSLLQRDDPIHQLASVDPDAASAASTPAQTHSHPADKPEAQPERQPRTTATPAASARTQSRRDTADQPHDPLPIPISRDASSRRHDQLDSKDSSANAAFVSSTASNSTSSNFQRHSSVPETDRQSTIWPDRLKMTRRQSVDEIVQSSSEFEDDDLRSLSTEDEEATDEGLSSHDDEAGASDFDPDLADEDELRMSGSEWDPRDATVQDQMHSRSSSARRQSESSPRPPLTRPPTVVQLQPYNNQVGGHNSIFQFSKRAVCKPLVGRENEFYEAVEREHPRLLAFIPQYLGVLNVTYRHNEEQRLNTPGFHRSTSDNNARKERVTLAAKDPEESSVTKKPDFERAKSERVSRQRRKVFEGQEEWGTDIPTVSLDLNRHIAPSWMLRKCRLPLGISGTGTGQDSHCSTPGRSRASSRARAELIASEQMRPSSTDITDSRSQRTSTLSSLEHTSKARLDQSGWTAARESERGTLSHPQTSVGSPDPASRHSRSIGYGAEWTSRNEHASSLETPNSSTSNLRAHSPVPGSLSMTSRTPSQSNLSSVNANCIHGRGFTTVNQRLQEQVLREVFSSPMLKNGESRYESNAKQAARKNRRRLAKAWEESEEGERLRLTRNFGPLKSDLALSTLSGTSTPDAPQNGRHSVASGALPKTSSTPAIYRGESRLLSTPPRTPPPAPSLTGPLIAVSPVLAPIVSKDTKAETDAFVPMAQGGNDNNLLSTQMDEVSAGLHHAKLEDSGANHDLKTSTAEATLSAAEETSQTRQFLLMEDLTGRLKSPCVLDLKMGTRQYGLDATDVKKRSQTKKCDKTTSRSHGVRICGMQVYDCVKENFLFQDKYYGRKVLPSDFPNALGNFFYDGSHILVHHIPLILQKIYHLARIVWHLRGYRFYASSLLFIYDGDHHTQQKLEEEFDQRCVQGHGGRVPYSPTVSILKAEAEEDAAPDEGEGRQSYSIGSSPLLGPVGETGLRRRRRRGEINIRIIDFAHCTTGHDYDFDSGLDQRDEEDALPVARFPPKLVNGPDSGYLYGLRNLAASFEQIWSTERERRRQCRIDHARLSGKIDSDADTILHDQDGKMIADLGPLEVEGGQVFDEIFGNGPHGLDGYVST